MAQTLRQVLSDLSGDIKALNLDDRQSFRFLASKFRDKIQVFIRQDARSRELVSESNIWKSIDCVEFKDVDVIDCCDVNDDTLIKKSKVEIPEAYSTTYGNLIKVFTLDGLIEYKEIKPFEYKDFINRPYSKGKYFWLSNKHLFVPDATFKAAKVLVIAKNPLEVDILNGKCNKCTSPLDAELNYPSYLITVAKRAVLDELSGITARTVVDEKPNLNENEKY